MNEDAGTGDPVSVLLHLSDTHFGAEDAQVLEDLVALVLDERPQAVVATGGITKHAKPAEFEAAARFLSRLAARHQLVVPGDHDLPPWDLLRRLVAPYAAFRQTFGDDLEPRLQSPDIWVAGQCSTRRWRRHEGTLSDAQVLRSAAWLSTAPAGALRVVALHHPVAAGPATRQNDDHAAGTRADPSAAPDVLHNAAFAVNAWCRAGVHLVLGGHTHQPGFLALHAAAERRTPMWAVQAGTAVAPHRRDRHPQAVNLVRQVGPSGWRVEQWVHQSDSAVRRSAFVLKDWVSIAAAVT